MDIDKLEDHNIDQLNLSEIIDIQTLQSIMDDFYSLTNIGMAILDINGNVLVATGWQDICTKFHRVHPESLKNCIESDTELTTNIQFGAYKIYKCKNNMWDISTPITIGGCHMGNLFLGQFLFEDESFDINVFISQAKKFGFNEEQYIDALKRLPRWTRETINVVMNFYTKFTDIISTLSYSNIKLAKTLAEREQAEKELSQNRNMLANILNLIPQGVFWKDVNSMYLGCNKQFAQTVGLDDPEQIRGKTDFDLPWPRNEAELYRNDDREVIENNKIKRHIIEPIQFFDGTRAWIDTTKVPITDKKGRVNGILGIYDDITERKKTEEQINMLLHEKELILKEVHHRIKNNMISISSLLSLQAHALTEPSAISALDDAKRRVDSMRLLYDKLYQTDDQKEISISSYLPALVDEIVINFPNSELVEIEKNIDDFLLNAKKLQPLGIIINELLTNIMKYAFTGKANGKISVSATVKDKQVFVTIHDNGIGMPKSVNFENSTGFGLRLVGMLAKQLNGTIRIQRNNGTEIILEFQK